jgi:hypothetical protein
VVNGRYTEVKSIYMRPTKIHPRKVQRRLGTIHLYVIICHSEFMAFPHTSQALVNHGFVFHIDPVGHLRIFEAHLGAFHWGYICTTVYCLLRRQRIACWDVIQTLGITINKLQRKSGVDSLMR